MKCLAICLFSLTAVHSANILGLFTSLSPSHNIVHLSVVKALIDEGHNVTIISRLPMNDKDLHFNHILLPLTTVEKVAFEHDVKETANLSLITMLSKLMAGGNTMITLQYASLFAPEVQNFINSGVKIDAVLLGCFFNDFNLAVAAQLKAPVIMSWAAGPFWNVNNMIGNPSELSYVPNIMLTTDNEMSFLKRIINFLSNGIFYLMELVCNFHFEKYYE